MSRRSDEEIKRMPFQDFVDLGFLQESNRQFFHPLGLALEVVVDTSGKVVGLCGVWDYREDSEGMVYADSSLNTAKAATKAENIRVERLRHIEARERLFGSSGIQPISFRPVEDLTPDEQRGGD